jgi:hypothetical protein
MPRKSNAMFCLHEYNRVQKNYENEQGELVEEFIPGDCVKKQCPYWLRDIKACSYCLSEDEIVFRRELLAAAEEDESEEDGEGWKKA